MKTIFKNNTKIIYFIFLLTIIISQAIINLFLDAFLNQSERYLQERNDQWSYYQSKSIKSKLYEIEKNNLIFTFKSESNKNKKELLELLINNLDTEIQRYKREQNDIQNSAIRLDNNHLLMNNKAQTLQFANKFLFISFWIVISAILLRIKNFYIFLFSTLSLVFSLLIFIFVLFI